MFTIMGADGKEYGPVTAGKVHEWIAGGRANLQTKARRDNETEWKTLGDFPEFSQFGTGGAAGPAAVPPVAAAAVPPPADAAQPAAAAVPVTPLTGSPKEIADAFIARAAPLDVFACLSRSFDLWKSNFLPLVGITLLVLVVQMVIGFIPILGMLSSFFLNGVFYGGLYYYYLGTMRGEHREVGDAFAGFSRGFVPLMLATLLTTVLILTILLPFFGSMFFVIFKAAAQGHAGAFPPISPLGLVGIFLGVIVAVYFSISWTFTFALVIDKGLGPWTAMEVSRRVVTHQWFRVFFVMLCGSILAMLGILGLIIGVFFTLPLVFGAAMYAYEDLFSPPGVPGTGS